MYRRKIDTPGEIVLVEKRARDEAHRKQNKCALQIIYVASFESLFHPIGSCCHYSDNKRHTYMLLSFLKIHEDQ